MPLKHSLDQNSTLSASVSSLTALASSSGGSRSPAPQPDSDLLLLPPEILHHILVHVGRDKPQTIAHVAATCRALQTFVYGASNTALWRDLILTRYDDPRSAAAFPSEQVDIDWRARFQDRISMECLFRLPKGRWDELESHAERISAALLYLFLDLPPRRVDIDNGPESFFTAPATRNGRYLESALRSEVFRYIYLCPDSSDALPPKLRTLPGNPYRRVRREGRSSTLARLHALLAPELETDIPAHREHRGYLRELVYRAVNYRPDNDWAPLHSDGTVDWLLVDAIGTVMMLNAIDVLSMGEEPWRPAVAPMSYGIEAVRGPGLIDLVPPNDGKPWDWAGVEGVWFGSYAFLDYRHWVQLNEPRLSTLRRGLAPLDLATYAEAIGDLMEMHLVVDSTPEDADRAYSVLTRENLRLPRLETHLPTNNVLPPVLFHGTSHHQFSIDSPRSFIRGVVRLTPDNPPEVRWTVVIRYSGEDRWHLEGVQVGGRQSRRGFFGIWTDAQREEQSPNGPVWYWKSHTAQGSSSEQTS